MVTLVLPTLREGQAAGFMLTTTLARTEGSGVWTGGLEREEGLASATLELHLLLFTPGLNGRCLARVATREAVRSDSNLL